MSTRRMPSDLLAHDPFRAPMVERQRQGRLVQGIAMNGATVPADFLGHSKPRIVVLGDDHEHALGPDSWPQAAELINWCETLVLHGGVGLAEDYAFIAEVAIECGKVLLVETPPRHVAAWMDLAKRAAPPRRLLVIFPKNTPAPNAPSSRGLH